MRRWCPIVLLAGCRPPEAAPCPTFAETEVIDEVGDPDALEEMRLAFSDFTSWTSRPGMCLTQVALVEEVPMAGASGQYVDGDRVLVEPGAVRKTTHHELCHAWDWTAGAPSAERPDLFPPVAESPAYPTEDERIAEAFADACAAGPRAVAEEELVATLCDGPSPLGDAEAWIREHVYDEFVDELDTGVAFAPMSISRDRLWRDASLADVAGYVPAGDTLAFLLRGSEGAPAWRLRLVDPVTVAMTELSVPAEADAEYTGLLGSNGAPIVWSANPLRAWRVDPADGTATALELPDDPETRFLSGYVHGGTAWLQPRYSGAAGTPYTLDLATGEVGPLLGADGAALETEVGIYGNGDAVTLNIAPEIETWSFAEAKWRSIAFPSVVTSQVLPLTAGHVAGVYVVHLDAGTQSVPVIGSLDASVWTFPDAPCGSSGWESGGELLSSGDVLYTLVDGSAGALDLLRVEP